MKRDKTFTLVTGSSRGIGRAIAEELAREGHIVAVHGSGDSAPLREAYRIVRGFSPQSIRLTGDLAEPKDIERMFAEIRKAFGRLDVLVNNAATQNPGPFLELRLEDWDRIMAVNLRAAFLCGQHAGRMMRDQGGGKIVNISSVHDTAPPAPLCALQQRQGRAAHADPVHGAGAGGAQYPGQ